MNEIMTMFEQYEKFNKAEKYIIGFAHKKQVYMKMVDSLDIQDIYIGQTSGNKGGKQLRFTPKAAHKAEMIADSICLGSIDMLIDSKYNKGEIFEKIVTEYYGQEWKKDNIPYYIQGDINLNGIEIQIKFEKAQLTTQKTLEKLLSIA